MSLKPIAPKKRSARPGVRPAGAPVVIVQKKSSGSGGLLVGVLILLALGGGYFVYNNQQKNEAALAAQQQRLEENAQRVAEAERQRAEYENQKKQKEEERRAATALGTAAPTASEKQAPAATPAPSAASLTTAPAVTEEEEEENSQKSGMGSTKAPSAGDGVFKVQDTSPAVFDLTTKGKAALKVMEALDKAIDKASNGKTYHDLQADLKHSFTVADPSLFADPAVLPPFPPKEEKLLRMAQGVFICLNLAAELEARNTIPEKEHAKFVNWLMKEKAKAARTFTYGVVEHCGITDTATAADLLDEVRQAYLISPTSGMKKIPAILKERAKAE